MPNRTYCKSKTKKEIVIKEPVNTEHILFNKSKTRICCARCLETFATTDKGLEPWMAGRCVAIGTSTDRPIPIILPIHLGNNCSHHTHKIYKYKHMFYCNKCGNGGTTQIRPLAQPCSPSKVGTGVSELQ